MVVSPHLARRPQDFVHLEHRSQSVILATSMTLYIQDPDNPTSSLLLEAMLGEAAKSTRGGAIFSFASSNGVELLLRDDAFRDFITSGTFRLVVGLDAVTDVAALEAVVRAAEETP